MSLLNKNNVGYGGWDTTPIQNKNDSNITNIDSLFEKETTNSSKLKPYKNQKEAQPIDENEFASIPQQQAAQNPTDSYVNPFSFDFGEKAESQPQPQTHASNGANSSVSNQNDVHQVFDLLFETNNMNSTVNNNNNDAFYAFDFGGNPKEKEAKKETTEKATTASAKQSKIKRSKTQSSSDSYSSSDSHSSAEGENEANQHNNKTVKISPPTKQSTRSKKRRNSKSSKTQNERAFEALNTELFDPSLISKVPISEIHSKSKNAKQPQYKKRHTEPVNIHSERQKQLVKEGLIQSPNVATKSKASKSHKTKVSKHGDNEEKEKQKAASSTKPAKGRGAYNVLPELHRGTALLKYGRRGYPHFRQFNLTADNENLRWFSSKKKLQQSSINVGSINEILTGQHTKEFRRISWTTLTPASFSIIYEEKKKSLNLVAKSVDEMKMWVQALRKLRDMKRKGENLKQLYKLQVEVDFRDRNRPQSRHHSGNFLRSHETKERSVDPILQRKLIDDIAALRKQFIEISREANNPILQSTKEYESIEQILSELEERIEELDHEVRNTRNTKIAENDVWRTRIDLESLREKIKVINKQHKAEYKNSKRRWSVF